MIDINTCFGFYPLRRADCSVERLVCHLEKHGIGKALTYSLRGVFYDYREGNEETLKVCENNDRFVPVAAINPKKVRDFEGEVKKIADSGFKAVRIFPEQQGWSVDQAVFSRLFKALEIYRLPLITGETPSKLYTIAGGSAIPIIFVSLHYYNLHDALAVFPERPNFFAESRQLNSPNAVALFIEVIGSGRLLYGSNLPLEYAGISAYPLEMAEIDEADREKILTSNAIRLFQL